MIFSGGVSGERDYVGVISYCAASSEIYYCFCFEHFDRLVILRLKVIGGQFGVISAYALFNELEYQIR